MLAQVQTGQSVRVKETRAEFPTVDSTLSEQLV